MCRILFLIYILFAVSTVYAAPHSSDSSKVKRNSVFGFPVIFYSPETRWGYGAAGIWAFHFKQDSIGSRPSRIQLGFAYTQNKQVLLYLPFQLYFKNSFYSVYGELGYYRYFYNFYGIGNNQPPEFKETYGVTFPRIRINALRKIKPNLYAGLRYWYENFSINSLDSMGQLAKENITGNKGGITSGAGVVINYDNRNNSFSPSKGSYIESAVQYFGPGLGSEYEYIRIMTDASIYFHTWKNQVLALNFFGETLVGDPPFNQLALLGGTKRMRGYYEGRYRDKNLLLFQTEYRIPLFWRIGMVLFGGLGEVNNKISNYTFNDIHYNYGTGLRFMLDKNEKINIRLDAGFGKETSGYYLTIGEAF
ncbi:MAG: BamA/TamA family outer membrane protein [Bacteroidota bacterium]|nr:BamA/TamA family outer membrane protein [Bacteroidota bacterium]